jgi:thiamine biosynthesis lipoprotein
MSPLLSRRRFIRITGIAAGLSLAELAGSRRPAAATLLHHWQGIALGADASLQLYHPDPIEAGRLIADALAEVRRLEQIFSLYQKSSALCRLNRTGSLTNPPQELVELLSDCSRFFHASGGAFDPTVQPLWDLYAGHFSQADSDPNGPPAAAIDRARAKLGFASVAFDGNEVRFLRPGMALTLNGIAQGYITDRVAELLRARGVAHTLVDMGETRALDNHPAGRPWVVGLEDPRVENGILRRVDIDNQAIATSGGYGTQFDAAGRFNHIFDPATGRCAGRYLSVSVIAPRATIADALSTALSVMPVERFPATLAEAGATEAYVLVPDGGLSHYAADSG